jgi:hypothetical protein
MTLSIATILRAKAILDRNPAVEPDHVWMTLKQWTSLGGSPEVWESLPEPDGVPNWRVVKDVARTSIESKELK